VAHRPGLGAALVAALALLLGPLGAPAQPLPFPEGIAAGDATHEAAVLWTRVPGGGDVAFEVASSPVFSDMRRMPADAAVAARDFAVKIDARDLRPGTRYHYRPVAAGGRGPAGTFVTAPALDADAPLTLTWGADTHERFQPFRAFEVMRAREPEAFLYLGDTAYTDQGRPRAMTPDEYRRKYRRNRRDEALRAFLASVSSWVTWDDHEVENNFHRDHPRLSIGRQVFLEVWPVRASAEEPGRLYRHLRWGRTADVYILDTRQYRSPHTTPDGPGKTMLGEAQKKWLLDGLSRSSARVKIVASSVPLRYASDDSWPGYAHERDEILAHVRDRGVRNVIFLSGDVHYAAWIRHPEGVHEGIAGPLGAFTAPSAPAAGRPGTLWTMARRTNFGELRVAPDGIDVSWRDADGLLLHAARLPIAR
jgi:alkaline phosphatase D